MEQRGDAATGTTSVLSTKPLQTVHCQRRRAPHHCGDLVRFQTTGLTSVDSLSLQVQIVIGKVRMHGAIFHSSQHTWSTSKTIKVAIMRRGSTWTSSIDAALDLSMMSMTDEFFLKERPTACSCGHPKKTYQRSHERPFALFMNVRPFARVCLRIEDLYILTK